MPEELVIAYIRMNEKYGFTQLAGVMSRVVQVQGLRYEAPILRIPRDRGTLKLDCEPQAVRRTFNKDLDIKVNSVISLNFVDYPSKRLECASEHALTSSINIVLFRFINHCSDGSRYADGLPMPRSSVLHLTRGNSPDPLSQRVLSV